MLLCLRVGNFAIIDELEVEFLSGLNVVTGETGAGKSILVSALQLVSGARGRPEVVRTGADFAEVEALFDIGDDAAVRARAEAAGVATGDELVIRRVVQRDGRTRAYANGRLASAAQLSELAEGLVSISSQHEHHGLVDRATQLQFLDAFGGLLPLAEDMAAAHRQLLSSAAEWHEAKAEIAHRAEREDLLKYQLREIDALEPRPGEREELFRECESRRHAERLLSLTGGAEDALYAREGALCEELARLAEQLRQAATLDARVAPLADQITEAQVQLEDAARELGRYARAVSIDPDRLAQLEERLNTMDRLQRKYGGSVESMLEHRERARHELAQLGRSDERIQELQAQLDRAQGLAWKTARELSSQRQRAAEELGRAIGKELASLGMGQARVIVEVEPAADRGAGGDPGAEFSVDGARLSQTGMDRVEFLIATNKGEAPRPLRKIASGGELSRAMLAIKRVLTGLGPAGLFVFDEVDAGIGGAIAEVVGRKLHEVARHHQVICITHLPQIAVFAEAHFQVHKKVVKGRTRSQIVRLSSEQRREEIARMLGGVNITAKTRAAAAEMLRSVFSR